jgi:hypothetical protein
VFGIFQVSASSEQPTKKWIRERCLTTHKIALFGPSPIKQQLADGSLEHLTIPQLHWGDHFFVTPKSMNGSAEINVLAIGFSKRPQCPRCLPRTVERDRTAKLWPR